LDTCTSLNGIARCVEQGIVSSAQCRMSSSPGGEVNDTAGGSEPPDGASCTNAIGRSTPPPLVLGADSALDKSVGSERLSSMGGGTGALGLPPFDTEHLWATGCCMAGGGSFLPTGCCHGHKGQEGQCTSLIHDYIGPVPNE
jgi:hypothetical protein